MDSPSGFCYHVAAGKKGGSHMSLLEVRELKKVYTTRFGGAQVQALRNVSFSVEEG